MLPLFEYQLEVYQRNLRSDGLPRLSGFFQIFQSSGNGGDDKCGKGAILTLDSIFHLLHHIGRKADRLINSRGRGRNLKVCHTGNLTIH